MMQQKNLVKEVAIANLVQRIMDAMRKPDFEHREKRLRRVTELTAQRLGLSEDEFYFECMRQSIRQACEEMSYNFEKIREITSSREKRRELRKDR